MGLTNKFQYIFLQNGSVWITEISDELNQTLRQNTVLIAKFEDDQHK